MQKYQKKKSAEHHLAQSNHIRICVQCSFHFCAPTPEWVWSGSAKKGAPSVC